MPRAHPIELRERVVNAYEDGEGTYVELAERFTVGEATVKRWVWLKARTGGLEPAPMGGSRSSLFDEAGLAFIIDVLEAVPDSTCRELVSAYEEEFGIVVGLSTMNDRVRKMGYTRKRGLSGRQLRSGPTSSSAEKRSKVNNRT